MDWAKTTAREDKEHLSLEFGTIYARGFTVLIDRMIAPVLVK